MREGGQKVILALIRCSQCLYSIAQCFELLAQIRSVAKDLAEA
jgi:hypothetical protein